MPHRLPRFRRAGRGKEINSGIDQCAAVKGRVFLDKSANMAALIEFNPPVAAGIVHFGAQYAADGFGGVVAVDERAQIGVGEAIAVHDQYWIAPQRATGKPDRASSAERRRLDHSRQLRSGRPVAPRCGR